MVLLPDMWTLAVCGMLFAIASYILLWRPHSNLANLPGPPSPSFLFGNFLEMLHTESSTLCEKWYSQYGPVIVYRGLMGQLRLSVADPKALNHILVQHAYRYPKPDELRGDLKRILGHGMFFSEGEAHKRQRKLLNPTFSPAQLKGIAPLVHATAQRLSAIWTEKLVVENGSKKEASIIDVLPWLNRATLNIIGEAGFGYEFNAFDEKQSELALALATITSTLGMYEGAGKFKVLAISLLRRFPGLSILFPTKRMRVVTESLELTVRESKKVLARTIHSQESRDDSKDLLSLLVRANTSVVREQDRMSDEEVMGQMTTFLIAGHETTGTALTWFLWLLAKYPEMQIKLRAELVEFTRMCEESAEDSGGTPFPMEKVNALPYLDAFCREGFRMFPSVPHTIKLATQDDKIPLSKPVRSRSGQLLDYISVHAGQVIDIPISAFHLSKEIFGDDAEIFSPDRWMGDNIPRSGTGVWAGLLTFLAGPRACIGFRLTLLEIKITLWVLLTKFRFEERDVGGGPKIARTTSIVMRPKVEGENDGSSMPLRVSLL